MSPIGSGNAFPATLAVWICTRALGCLHTWGGTKIAKPGPKNVQKNFSSPFGTLKRPWRELGRDGGLESAELRNPGELKPRALIPDRFPGSALHLEAPWVPRGVRVTPPGCFLSLGLVGRHPTHPPTE